MGQLIEKGLRASNFLDYTTWISGTTGSQTGFNRNGDDAENYIIDHYDPFGKSVPIWEARPDADSDPDGGWITDIFDIDQYSTYRFSVWVKRNVIGNGHFYFGLNAFDITETNDDILRRNDGVSGSNPYFEVNTGWSEWGEVATWYLVVGHVWPLNSGTGSNHVDSGIYDVNGNLIDTLEYDYVWDTSNVKTRHRSYLYYSTDITTRQEWVYPRIDKIDGTEPSLRDLINGYDSLVYDELVKYQNDEFSSFSVSTSGFEINRISELGPTDGLISYYPLDGNANDYAGGINGTAYSGVVFSAGKIDGGITLDGTTNSYIGIPYSTTHDLLRLTIAAWVNFDGDSPDFIFEKGNVNTQYSLFSHGGDIVFRTKPVGSPYETLNPSKVTAGIVNGQWHHICATYDGITKRIYVDGGEKASVGFAGPIEVNPNGCSIGRFGGTSSGYHFNGKIDEVRIYKRALSSAEAQVLYDIGKVKIGKLITFVNKLKEA